MAATVRQLVNDLQKYAAREGLPWSPMLADRLARGIVGGPAVGRAEIKDVSDFMRAKGMHPRFRYFEQHTVLRPMYRDQIAKAAPPRPAGMSIWTLFRRAKPLPVKNVRDIAAKPRGPFAWLFRRPAPGVPVTPAPAAQRKAGVTALAKHIAAAQAPASAAALRSWLRMRQYALLARRRPEKANYYRQNIRAEVKTQAKIVAKQRANVLTRLRNYARADIRARIAAAKRGEAPLPAGLAKPMTATGMKAWKPVGPWKIDREDTILASLPH